MTKTTIVLEYLKTQSEPLTQYDIYNNLLSYCDTNIWLNQVGHILKYLVANDEVTLTQKHAGISGPIVKYYKYEGEIIELDWFEFIRLYNYTINVYEFNSQETFDEMRRLIVTANPTNMKKLNDTIDRVINRFTNSYKAGVLGHDMKYRDLICEIVYCKQTLDRIERNIDDLEFQQDDDGAFVDNTKAIAPWLDYKADTIEQMITARQKIYNGLVNDYAGNPQYIND